MNENVIALAAEHLEKKFGCKLDTKYYSTIRTWRDWWRGYVKEAHSYRELGVDGTVKQRKLYSFGMAKKVTEDWASLLLNEKTEIVVDDAASSEWLQGADGTGGVLGEVNFWAEGNELIEKAFAYGTGAFVARADGAMIKDSGAVIPDEKCRVAVEYMDALSIIPLSVEKSRITEVAFVSEFIKKGKRCVYLETHTKNEGGHYQIENEFFVLDGSTLKASELPEGVAGTIDTGSSRPWFALIYPNITVNNEDCNGLGMSVYANALDNLLAVDIAFNNFIKDFKLGGKKVFYNRSMLQTNKDGETITPDDVAQQLFQQVGDGMDFDAANMVQEYNPQLRVDENKNGLQATLDYLSFACGLGTHRYKFEQSGTKTATEYNGERQDMVQHANRHMIVLEAALKTICSALLYIGKVFCNAAVNPDAEISVIFSDGFVIDEEAKAAKDMQLVSQGILNAWEYRVRHFGEDEATAKAMINDMKTANENPFGFMT